MILNKFLDKTIEAAKQSALQMYGNDLTALKSILQDTNDESEEDRPDRHRENGEEERRLLSAATKPSSGAGVTFERSERGDPKKSAAVESRLTAIRAYAARQTASDIDEINGWKESAGGTSPSEKGGKAKNAPNNLAAKQVYSRKDLRGPGRAAGSTVNDNKAVQNNRSTDGKKKADSGARDKQPFLNVAKTGANLGSGSRPAKSSAPEEKESPLHQRLDRLESLMHLTLSSDDLSYASHPAYHKLLHKGVPQRLISDWFHTISDQGIHPGEQQKLFNSKLSNIICEAVTKAKARSAGQLLFFMGRSGAGKTHLIMKLSQHPRVMADKKIAVVSLEPPAGTNRPYYTILAPFCRDHDLPYYRLRAGTTADAMIKQWKQFDHILIDTPSMETMEENSFKQLMKIKQQLQSAYSSETHYLINTAVNGVAFHDPLATRTEADHLALTHIDKSNRWGQAVQLIAQTDYSLRFISSGERIPADCDIFNPERFAEKLLN